MNKAQGAGAVADGQPGGTHIRNEGLLGPVYVVALEETVTGQRATRVSYELNVIDGWGRVSEWTDESGLVWEGQSTSPCRVRTVLDAAPQHAEFIAKAHLSWIKALAGAGGARRASSQRRALNSALHRHGLELARPAAPTPEGHRQ